MGGTTAKICLIEDFTPKTARSFEVARTTRFAKGSGIPISILVIEMIEIGGVVDHSLRSMRLGVSRPGRNRRGPSRGQPVISGAASGRRSRMRM